MKKLNTNNTNARPGNRKLRIKRESLRILHTDALRGAGGGLELGQTEWPTCELTTTNPTGFDAD